MTDRAAPEAGDALVFHPPVLALGIGCERGCPADEIAALFAAGRPISDCAPPAS